MIEFIMAKDINNGISKDGKIPWYSKKDFQFFREITTNKNIVMGKKTWDSLPKKPLPNRNNIIITSNKNFKCTLPNVEIWNKPKLFDGFVIGGKEIYNYYFKYFKITNIYITTIKKDYQCDLFVDLELKNYICENIYEDSEIKIDKFKAKYLYKNMEGEQGYLKLLFQVSNFGEYRQTRNANTYSLFGESLLFDLSEGFPLLTTKKMFWKGVVEELLWFLRADTNSKHLEEKGINIWKGNSTRKFLDSLGLDYPEGECGPIYGYQWRHFNAPFNVGEEPTGGIDQLMNIINDLKNNKTSRRMIMSGWNPTQEKQMVLPPCHLLYQFYVRNDQYLDCQMYARSQDLFLGTPFNIASTSLLTEILANFTGLKAGTVKIIMGDCHIYEQHKSAVDIQLGRTPQDFPKLKILRTPEKIEDYKFEDFELINYNPQSSIKADMIP